MSSDQGDTQEFKAFSQFYMLKPAKNAHTNCPVFCFYSKANTHLSNNCYGHNMPSVQKHIAAILAKAGIQINGSRPWDIQVNDLKFYSKVARDGLLGLGDAYVLGYWECQALDQFFFKALRANLPKYVRYNKETLKDYWINRIFNLQNKNRAFIVGKKHYDIGNDVYENMLDRRLTYTCAYWKNAKNLDQAQQAKLDLVCKKIGLKKEMTILDIGCGWGSFAKYAAQKYGAKVTGITISKEQVEFARKSCKNLPVKILLQDYRDMNEKFDRIVSLGMFEHVGEKNYREYFRVVRRCLKDDGLFLLQTMGQKISYPNLDQAEKIWITKHIFPNGMLPSVAQIGLATEQLFVIEDWHNFRAHYDKTFMAWFANFDNNWSRLQKRYDQKFYRAWKYYLHCFAGAFRSGKYELWQIVLSKNGLPQGYNSIR